MLANICRVVNSGLAGTDNASGEYNRSPNAICLCVLTTSNGVVTMAASYMRSEKQHID